MPLDDIRAERLKKLNLLKERGVDPYPARSERTASIGDFLADFKEGGGEATLSGRIMAVREHGGSLFVDLFDGTGRVQGYLKKDELGDDAFSLFEKAVDIGDFIEISGTAFVTKRGESSLSATRWRMLAKTLLPLPEKRAGLKDTEERLRKRYLDLLFDEELRAVFKKKTEFWGVLYDFLTTRGFLEVQTPTLELTTGGAEARPFRTHHNDFDLDVFLRISVGELWQKRLMAAGFPRTFEIGRVYRNEGSSAEHIQEFTNMEFYAAYMNFEEGKALVQELYRTLAQEVFGKTEFSTRGHTFDLADEWEDVDYVARIKKVTGVDVLNTSAKKMQKALAALGVEYAGENEERLMDTLWKYCRRQISGPAFLVNHPKQVAPLSKADAETPELTKTFQVLLAGSEVGRAHAELNDPLDQRARFEAQQKLLEEGDEEAMMPEWDFIEMLEYGMPPTFGFGVGERLFSFFVDKPIREIQLFPLMKPRE